MVNIVQTDYDPPEFEVNAVTTTGRTRVYTLRGEGQLNAFNETIDDLGADAPQLVGSPKALAAMRSS